MSVRPLLSTLLPLTLHIHHKIVFSVGIIIILCDCRYSMTGMCPFYFLSCFLCVVSHRLHILLPTLSLCSQNNETILSTRSICLSALFDCFKLNSCGEMRLCADFNVSQTATHNQDGNTHVFIFFTRVYFNSQQCHTINERHVHCGCIGSWCLPYITCFPTLTPTLISLFQDQELLFPKLY